MSAVENSAMLWRSYLHDNTQLAAAADPLQRTGFITRAAGLVLEAVGLRLSIGATCQIVLPNRLTVEAEVVGFAGDRLYLMPASEVYGLAPGARVIPVEPAPPQARVGSPLPPRRRAADRSKQVPVGAALLGRVVDGAGRPLDQLGALRAEHAAPLYSRPFNPLERAPIRRPLDVGVRAINSLLSVGAGQRLGLFAGSGVGKSVLLGMMARYTSADVTVVGLIGERGREVQEFIEDILGPDGLARAVVIAAPADVSPLLRLHGAAYATAVAEHFRAKGHSVLLIMDSLTRYAQAQREIGLAVGEPPATKGYPPSVFARLPQLVERAGNAPALHADGSSAQGSITAFYTVLTEGDDPQDPIADAARAVLDGHIVLARELAEQGHYPAIDVEASISRVMPNIVEADQLARAHRFKALFARYRRNRDLINVGAIVAGADLELDEAIALYPRMTDLLRQGVHERADFSASGTALAGLFS